MQGGGPSPLYAGSGNRTLARNPPIGLSSSVISPPWARTMSRAIVSPSPVPPEAPLSKGRNTLSRRVGLDARAVIIDHDQNRAPGCQRRQSDAAGMAPRIVDKIGDRAPDGVGAQMQRQRLGFFHLYLCAGAAGAGGDILQHRKNLDLLRLLGNLAAGERKITR